MRKPQGNDQLLEKCEHQHDRPCAGCPWSRNVRPNVEDLEQPSLGGSPAEVYVGQALLSFRLPCHMRQDYTKLEERLDNSKTDCAGAAIFRANQKVDFAPQLLHLPEDKEAVFSNVCEFYAHHKGISVDDARKILDHATIDFLKEAVFAIAQIKMLAGKAKLELFPR